MSAQGSMAQEEWASRTPDLGHIQALLSRPLRIALPCVGLSNASDALRNHLKIKHVPVHQYDLLEYLRGPILALHPDLAESEMDLHLGAEEGDICKATPSNMAMVDGLVAGPPCPPWSSKGLRGAASDARSQVFDHVIEICMVMAARNRYFFAILENVAGIKKWVNKQPPYIYRLRQIVRDRNPHLDMHVWDVDAKDYLLPQSRPRVYVALVPRPPEPLQQPTFILPTGLPKFEGTASMSDFLDHSMPPVIAETLGEKRWQRLEAYKDILGAEMDPAPGRDGGKAAKHAIVDIDREPYHSQYGQWLRKDDLCFTLTTGENAFFVLGLASGRNPPMHRFLHEDDRARMQGVDPARLRMMTRKQKVHAIGNAFAVPCIGVVFAHVLRYVSDLGGGSALSLPSLGDREGRGFG